jgi:hypothetical protein
VHVSEYGNNITQAYQSLSAGGHEGMDKKKNKHKWLILMTTAGLLATTAAAGADGIVDKVSGLLRGDITVSVNGEDTAIHPVYIDGKAYLPARDMAGALGIGIQWSGKEIELTQKEDGEEALDYLMTSGVIVDVSKTDDGRYRLEVLGHGPNKWIILYADADTVLTDAEGKPFGAADLKAGMQLTAEYGPIIALSYPGQSHAATIQVGQQRLIQEAAVIAVEDTEGGKQILIGETKDGKDTVSVVLNMGKETMLVNAEGQPVEWADIKAGSMVRAYYGPIMTKSLPPQSPAHVVVLLDRQEQLAPAAEQEFRELAWTFVSEEEKGHLTTAKEEAQVELVDAAGAAVMGTTEEQQAALAELQAAGGKLVAVTYRTDQDALLGPLTVAIHPDTKALLGFFVRM